MWKKLSWVCIFLYIIATLIIACQLEVAYYDSFTFYNAAKSFSHPNITYRPDRPPLLVTLLIPFMSDDFTWAFRAPFILATTITVLFLFVSYLFLARRFSPKLTFYGILLLLLNPLVIHYGPFPLHDFLSGLLFTTIGILYLRARKNAKTIDLILLGLSAGLLTVARYNLGLVLPILFLCEIIICFQEKNYANFKKAKFWFCVFFLPLLFAFFYASTVFAIQYGSYQKGLQEFAAMFMRRIGQPSFPFTDPWYEYVVVIPLVFSLPITILIVLGIFRSFFTRTPQDVFALVGFLVLFLAHSFLFKHKETRYLVPFLSLFFYFALLGMAVLGKLSSKLPKAHIWQYAFLIASLVLPGFSASKEWKNFSDPIYTTNYWRNIGKTIRNRVPKDQPIYRVGIHNPLFPKDYKFHEYDDYFHIFHFGYAQLQFFTHRVVKRLHHLTRLIPSETVPLELARTRTALVSLYSKDTTTRSLPPSPPPVHVYFYHYISAELHQGKAQALILKGKNKEQISIGKQVKIVGVSLHPQTKRQLFHIYPLDSSGSIKIMPLSQAIAQIKKSKKAIVVMVEEIVFKIPWKN